MSQLSTSLLHVSMLVGNLALVGVAVRVRKSRDEIRGNTELTRQIDRDVTRIAGTLRRQEQERARVERARVRPPGIKAAVAAGAGRRRTGTAAATVRSTVLRADVARRRTSANPAGGKSPRL
ncbi:hypothetical protein ACIBFB_11690 [Nocardiopsis sp. NPDC050513]|uniref:hypothetical protein n=1 Tax=Nocardiopsis sp. NPDC050513 TaxID=3364338 RepID=UPI00378FA038